jgi:hypothetical protein
MNSTLRIYDQATNLKFKVRFILIWLPLLLSPLQNISESIWNFKWDIVSSTVFEKKDKIFLYIFRIQASHNRRNLDTKP